VAGERFANRDTGDDVPPADRAIAAATDDLPTVGRHRHREHRPHVAGQRCTDRSAGDDIPPADRPVVAAADDLLAVRRHGERLHPLLVPDERLADRGVVRDAPAVHGAFGPTVDNQDRRPA
jgi:hypothetical protein